MKKLGKILSLVMALALAISTLTVTALADEPEYISLSNCDAIYNFTVTEISEQQARIYAQDIIDTGLVETNSLFIFSYDDVNKEYKSVQFRDNKIYTGVDTESFENIWLSGVYEATYFCGSIGEKIEKPAGFEFKKITSITELFEVTSKAGSLTAVQIAALAFSLEKESLLVTTSSDGQEGKLYDGYECGYKFEELRNETEIDGVLIDEEAVYVLVDVEPETTAAPTTAAPTTAATTVKTGDSFNITLCLIALITLVSGACVTLFATKRR